MSNTKPATVEQLDELARTTKSGFDDVTEQFHEVNGRLDKHDEALTRIENRLDGHDRRFDGLDRRIDAVAQDVGEVLSIVKKLVTRREHETLKKKVLALSRAS